MAEQRWILFAIGSAVFAAMTAITGKLGVETIPSNVAVLLRTAVILLMTAAIVAVRREWPPGDRFSWNGAGWLFVSAIATGLSWLCYYRALSLAPASRVAPIDKMSVVLVLLFAAVLLGEAMTWRTILGSVLITVGVILVAWNAP